MSVAREYLAAADTKKTWSPEDDKKYRATIANLPQETKFQLTKDLFVRLNSQEIKVLHKPRGTGPQLCAPALCEASPVQRQDPKTTGKVDAK